MFTEYSVVIGYQCNLRCSFCYIKERFSKTTKVLTNKQLVSIINYIAKDSPGEKKLITFIGGEPLMNYQTIKRFIKKASGANWSFSIYTNGLLLNSVPLNILKALDVILVSIDGDKKAQEKNRGEGTYHKILNNIKEIKPKIRACIVGRITVEENTNIFDSVINLLKYTDAVHWQIVNKPKFKNEKKFLANYKKGVSKLFDYWLSHFEKGVLLNIIPFQAIIATLLFDYPNHRRSFRCGAGRSLKVIDIDGKIYWCDEFTGNSKALIGNVIEGTKIVYKKHTNLFSDCRDCFISVICRGRCRKCLEEYPVEQIRAYCKFTKCLIDIINRKKKKIKQIAKINKYNIDKIYDLRKFIDTEEIP